MVTITARLSLRLHAHEMDRIAQAAELRGVAVSAFARDAVLRAADTALAAEATVTLSDEESRRFLAALDTSFRANDRLRNATKDAAKLRRC